MNLSIEQLRVSMGGFLLELDVRLQSHVTGVFGPSGAGKTTLLDAITGLVRPMAGAVRLGDRTLSTEGARTWVPVHERRIGYVPQDLALFPHRSVRGNLLYGRVRSETTARRWSLEEVAELLEIDGLLDRSIGALSGGERQRVALARALLSSPDLLLLDEPLSSLDARLKQRILPFLARVKAAFPLPILYVSHDPSEIAALCDEVLVLDGGRLVRRGEPGALFAAEPRA